MATRLASMEDSEKIRNIGISVAEFLQGAGASPEHAFIAMLDLAGAMGGSLGITREELDMHISVVVRGYESFREFEKSPEGKGVK